VEKIKLLLKAFGGILAFLHRESDFNRNQTRTMSNPVSNPSVVSSSFSGLTIYSIVYLVALCWVYLNELHMYFFIYCRYI
jgi:uncharacterized protein (DUF2062 family)